jgi:glycosyltransferase involved in cell wall biosynthesis
MLRYAVVTPARNESDNLPRLAAAMQAQSQLPVTWLIVDDGSDDGTRELAVALAEQEPWIEVVDARPDRGGPLEAGRREGRDLLAFRLGVDRLPVPVDVVVKVDADVAFAPDFFHELCARFEADPSLAIASGSCHELEDGEWVHRRIVQGAVWGATRAYRWDALDAVMTLEPRLGWDGLDEFRVQLRGCRTEAFTDLVFQHHRREHSREPGRWRAHADQGRATWYMGYRPSYVALRSLYRARDDRAALAMAYGYAHAALRRDARFPEREVRRAIRRRQRFLVTLRRGAPSS